MHELLLALSLLAPVPGADPAPPTFQVPINSKVTAPDGKVWTFVGTLTVTVEEPAPPPTQPTITAVKNAAGGGVESIRSGETLVIEGVKLWQEGVPIRVQIPGRTAAVLSASPTRLEVRFPAIAAPMTGPLMIYHNLGTGLVLVCTGPRITVNPAAPAPAAKPVIKSFSGSALQGEGFGSVKGTVRAGSALAPVLSWSDGEVRLSPLAPGAPWYWLTFVLERPDGEWASLWGEVR